MQLMAHQSRGVEISREQPRFAYYWDPGTGKTIMTFACITDAMARGFHERVLVLAPKSILKVAWLADAAHFPQLKTIVMWSSSPAKRKAMIAGDWDVCITNYESFKKHAEQFRTAGVGWLVIDECSKVKNYKSDITQDCIEFSKFMSRVTLLSGTPAPNGPVEYIPQLFILNPDRGTNFYKVANYYFFPVKRTINGRELTLGWNLRDDRSTGFYEHLRARSWALSREECIDLPGEQDIIRPVELSKEESAAYFTMLDQLRVEIAGPPPEVYSAKTAAKLMKLRQLASGIFYTPDGTQTIGTSKLDALGELLDELSGESVVIWAEFTAEIDAIMQWLTARGATAGRIDGTASLDSRTDAIYAFQNKRLQYLVCQPQAAGHGITLTTAAYDVFYSCSFSYETHEQARARIYRKGQTRKVIHYYLLATETVDEAILMTIQKKRSVSDAVMEYLGQKTGVPV